MKHFFRSAAVLVAFFQCDASPQILNLKFGGVGTPDRKGAAAVGQGPEDYWNRYSRDRAGGGYLHFGVSGRLLWSDRSESGAGVIVENAPGLWGNGHPDPMFGEYIYAFNGRPITITLTNLPAGTYTVYAFGHGGPPDVQNTAFSLRSAHTSYPDGRTTTRNGWLSPVWTEGVHYVRFTNVSVHPGYPVVLKSYPDAFPQAIVNALQIVRELDIPNTPTPSEPPPPLPTMGNESVWPPIVIIPTPPPVVDPRIPDSLPRRLPTKVSGDPRQLLNIQFGINLGPVKVGAAALGQSDGDFWNLYSRDGINGSYRYNGEVAHLFWANGDYSGASITVTNAAGWWSNGHPDAMFGGYLYPLGNPDNSKLEITVSNLAPGTYSILAYSHGGPPAAQNSEVELLSGTQFVGAGKTSSGADWSALEWQPNRQYVHFSNVVVMANSPVKIMVRPDATAQVSVINGLQFYRESGPAEAISIPPSQLTFQPQPGPFSVETRVLVQGALWNSTIRYTLDGSEPLATSPVFESPLQLTDTATIRARAFSGDQPSGSEISGVYIRQFVFNDGIPIAWRQRYFGTNYLTIAAAAAEADPDQDGSTNYQEFSAGSDPLDPSSGFLVAIRRVPSISWKSEAGKIYLIKRKDQLTDPEWIAIKEVVATGPFSRFTDEDVANVDSFYVVIPKP